MSYKVMFDSDGGLIVSQVPKVVEETPTQGPSYVAAIVRWTFYLALVIASCVMLGYGLMWVAALLGPYLVSISEFDFLISLTYFDTRLVTTEFVLMVVTFLYFIDRCLLEWRMWNIDSYVHNHHHPKYEKVEKELERAIPGSVPVVSKDPRFQFDILSKGGHMLGKGFRAVVDGRDILITADHVLTHDEVLLQRGEVQVLMNTNGFTRLPVADMAYLPYEARYAVLGLGRASIGVIDGKATAWVTANGNGTVGDVSENGMARVKFNASTYRGFSGAPYYMGKVVYGMHLGSMGPTNFGLAAGYIPALFLGDIPSPGAAISKKKVNEASAEFLERHLSAGTDIEWATTGSPDVISVKVRGRYFLLDSNDESDAAIIGKVKSRYVKPARFSAEYDDLEGSIPTEDLPQVATGPSPFLGARPVVVIGKESQTQATTTPIPVIVSSGSAGPIDEKKTSGDRTTSTKTSQLPKEKVSERKSLTKHLVSLSRTMDVGAQEKIASCLERAISTRGLKELLEELLQSSTGKPPSDVAR